MSIKLALIRRPSGQRSVNQHRLEPDRLQKLKNENEAAASGPPSKSGAGGLQIGKAGATIWVTKVGLRRGIPSSVKVASEGGVSGGLRLRWSVSEGGM